LDLCGFRQGRGFAESRKEMLRVLRATSLLRVPIQSKTYLEFSFAAKMPGCRQVVAQPGIRDNDAAQRIPYSRKYKLPLNG